MIYEIAIEHMDGTWETYYAGKTHDQAVHEYARHAERMYREPIKRAQLRRGGQFLSETTR